MAWPTRSSFFPAGALLPATFKTYLVDFYDQAVALLGSSGTPAGARTALGFDAIVGTAGAVSSRNKLINGGAEVAQRSALSLSTSAQYGQVDRCAIWASGGAVSAGMITQVTAATVGRTGKAARAAGVTLTGSGVISWRYRMEAADAVKLKNQTGSFQIAAMHDVGSSINYTIIIRKATAADNFASTTVINTGSATSVLTGTATVLKSEGVSLGDCSNGLEIEVQVACGAVTTKNFDFTDWQIEEGATATTFERPLYSQALRDCRRYYFACGVLTNNTITTGGYPSWLFPDAMRAVPTIASNGNGNPAMGAFTDKTGFYQNNNGTSQGAQTVITCSAEL